MTKKMFLLFLILNFNMTYSQKLDNSLHKKWLVYNTPRSAKCPHFGLNNKSQKNSVLQIVS